MNTRAESAPSKGAVCLCNQRGALQRGLQNGFRSPIQQALTQHTGHKDIENMYRLDTQRFVRMIFILVCAFTIT